jgi:uncharacterized RDD family membrane protein YckC
MALPIAGIGFRTIAYLLDALLLFFFWVCSYFTFTLLSSDLISAFVNLSGVIKTLAVIGAFATQWLYWTLWEVLGHGQTPGKRLLGIRVVSDDGSSATVLQSAVRNLCRMVDFLPVLYGAGLLTMLVSRENRRLGDLLAGTVLVREERIALDKYEQPASLNDGGEASAAPLAAADVELILSFLSRAHELTDEARDKLTASMIARYAAGLSEPERDALMASRQGAEAFLRRRAERGS